MGVTTHEETQKTPHFGHTFGTGAEMGRVGGPQGRDPKELPIAYNQGTLCASKCRSKLLAVPLIRLILVGRMAGSHEIGCWGDEDDDDDEDEDEDGDDDDVLMMVMMSLWFWCIYDVDVYVTSV